MNNITRILVIVGIISLLGVGVWWAVFHYTAPSNPNISLPNANVVDSVINPVDTSGWQPYRNTRFSYEFRYPSAWQLADSLDSPLIDPNALDITFSSTDPNQVNRFSVDTISSPDCTTALECAQERLPSRAGQSYAGEDVLTPVVVGGREGIGLIRKRLDSGKWHYRMAYLLKDGALFYLEGIASPDATGLNDAVINTIFDSVTFTTE